MRFHVATPGPIEITEGTLIDYGLRVRGVPMRWRSEISGWNPPYRFIDRQLRGPYRWWSHAHTFEPAEGGGTRVIDQVDYGVPGGALIHRLFVGRDLRAIFEYRTRKLRELFGEAD